MTTPVKDNNGFWHRFDHELLVKLVFAAYGALVTLGVLSFTYTRSVEVSSINRHEFNQVLTRMGNIQKDVGEIRSYLMEKGREKP